MNMEWESHCVSENIKFKYHRKKILALTHWCLLSKSKQKKILTFAAFKEK